MKTILNKMLYFLRDLFALLRVTLTLQIGKAEGSKEVNEVDEDHLGKESDYDSKSDSL